MSLQIENRAFFGWPKTPAGVAQTTMGIAIHYDGSDQGLAVKPHTACRDYWRATRRFHMGPSRGWVDIGYSYMVCPHGIVLEGRGFGHIQAAQPGGNSSWTSVTFASGPTEKPTDAQIQAFRELRTWLRANRRLLSGIRPHSSWTSTTCPGDILRRLISDGTLSAPPLEDLNMDAKAVHKAVWETDAIPAPDGSKDNPTWRASSMLVDIDKRVRAVEAAVAEIKALLTAPKA